MCIETEKMQPYIYVGLSEQEQRMVRLGRTISDPQIIINHTCEALNVSHEDIRSPSRKKEFSEARIIAIGLIFQVNEKMRIRPLQEFFKRDHSTIIYNRDLYNDLYNRDKAFTAKANKVLELV